MKQTVLPVHEFKKAIKTDGKSDAGIYKDMMLPMENGSGREITFTISTDDVDTSHDVIKQDGWSLDYYKMNPVVLWAHNSGQLPIGKCTWIAVVDGKLKATVDFAPMSMNPLAEQVFQMCKSGFLNATSVGCRPTEYEWSPDDNRDGGLDYLKCVLFEFSIVPVPANPFALIDRPTEMTIDPSVQSSIEPSELNNKTNSKEMWKFKHRLLELTNFNPSNQAKD
jgi:HK97 family phage prohead protease